jgi:hypothetical protein
LLFYLINIFQSFLSFDGVDEKEAEVEREAEGEVLIDKDVPLNLLSEEMKLKLLASRAEEANKIPELEAGN